MTAVGSTSSRRSGTRKYGKKASEKVQKAMHEMKRGKLHSGSSGKVVRSPKQAIAIGLSEARRGGAKVPRRPSTRKSTSRSTARKVSSPRAHAR